MRKLIYSFLYFLLSIGCADPQPGITQHFVGDKYISTSVVSAFGNSQNYYTGDNTGPQADSVGFSVWSVNIANYPPIPTNDGQLLFGKTNHNANKVGWGLYQFQGETSFFMGGGFVRNDNDTITKVNAISSTWDEVNKLQVIHAVVRHKKIYMYKNGIRSGSGFPITVSMMSFLTTTKGISIGSFGFVNASNFYPYQSGIVALGISPTGLTDAQVEAHYQAILSNVYAQAPSTSNLFRASDAGATWTDAVGGLVATRASSASVSTVSVPFYRRWNPSERYLDLTPIFPSLPNAKIMTVADSRGIGGTPHNSFRLHIYNLIMSDPRLSGVTMVGPVFNAAFPMGYYAAYGGTSYADFINGTNGPSVPSVLIPTYDPDVIVMLLGVNNLPAVSQQDDFITLVKTYHALKPSMRFVFIDESNALFSGPTRDAQMQSIDNWRWREGYIKLRQAGIDFRVAPMYSVLNPTQGDFLLDAFFVHPTEHGFLKMSVNINKALLAVLGYNQTSKTINTSKPEEPNYTQTMLIWTTLFAILIFVTVSIQYNRSIKKQI